MIRIHNLTFQYAGTTKPTVNCVDLEMHAGHINVLMGPSGCGKSTLLKVLTGLYPALSGTLDLDDTKSLSLSARSQKDHFSMMPQLPTLLPWKTIAENIALGCPPERTKTAQTKAITDALQAVGLVDFSNHYPHQLSVGMASRVSFARTLVLNRPGVLLDEPFAALDAITRMQLQAWIKDQVQRSGQHGLLVTHDLYEAIAVGTTIYFMNSVGAVVRRITAKESNADQLRSWFLELTEQADNLTDH
jgi:NitT/TauT family transport system ATP-binding protein